ncbi:hypothetical protein V8E53_009189 [Lactarius tabidus]
MYFPPLFSTLVLAACAVTTALILVACAVIPTVVLVACAVTPTLSSPLPDRDPDALLREGLNKTYGRRDKITDTNPKYKQTKEARQPTRRSRLAVGYHPSNLARDGLGST